MFVDALHHLKLCARGRRDGEPKKEGEDRSCVIPPSRFRCMQAGRRRNVPGTAGTQWMACFDAAVPGGTDPSSADNAIGGVEARLPDRNAGLTQVWRRLIPPYRI